MFSKSIGWRSIGCFAGTSHRKSVRASNSHLNYDNEICNTQLHRESGGVKRYLVNPEKNNHSNIPKRKICLQQLEEFSYFRGGEMAERLIAPVLKTGLGKTNGGSNPSLSAVLSAL